MQIMVGLALQDWIHQNHEKGLGEVTLRGTNSMESSNFNNTLMEETVFEKNLHWNLKRQEKRRESNITSKRIIPESCVFSNAKISLVSIVMVTKVTTSMSSSEKQVETIM